MSYTPDPTDVTQPSDSEKAKTAAAEFRALKAYIRTLLGLSVPNPFPAITVPSINGGQIAGFRSAVKNGKMEVAQNGTSFVSPASGTYTLDGWVAFNTSAALLTHSQQADVPADNEFQASLRAAVTTADAAIAAGDSSYDRHWIEGYDARNFIGNTFTVSFWMRSAKTGIHCVALKNTGTDRTYVAEVTVLAANTWEKKSFTVTGGLPTAGTWNWTNGQGLALDFVRAAGTTFHTTAGAWNTGNFLSTASQVNCLDTIGNIYAITGIQLERGAAATPFEHRSFAVELSMMQRYFWIGGFGWSGVCISATNGSIAGTFPVTMRAAPVFAGIAGAGSNALVRSGAGTETIGAYVNSGADKNGAWLYFSGAGYTTGALYTAIKDLVTASARL